VGVKEQIANYIASQPEPKRSDMQELHRVLLQVSTKIQVTVPGMARTAKAKLFPTSILAMVHTP
jgi:hypothetical protein